MLSNLDAMMYIVDDCLTGNKPEICGVIAPFQQQN